MTYTMQIMRATIRRTLSGCNAKPQSAWSKPNSSWSNLPKAWGSPTLVCSTSGRNYGWLGFWRRSISPLSGDRTIGNSCKIVPCTGRWELQSFWRLWQPGHRWKILIKPDGFRHSGSRCFWTNVQLRFRRRERREGGATSNRRWIWESARAPKPEVTFQSCQIQLSWLWFVECRMATMTRHPECNSKRHTQMWDTGRSWLISLNKIVAQKNHTVWPWYTNTIWRRKKWTKSIWDYTHQVKWWMTLYMVRFHTTVPFLMLSSWNWVTMWNYFW